MVPKSTIVGNAAWRRLALALVAMMLAPAALAAGHALRFNGTGAADVDRVKIRVDDPSTALPGPAADVGAGDFTVEFWLKTVAGNNAPAVACGANRAWTSGNVVVDRDRFNQDRGFGIAIAGGKLVFGVSGQGTGDFTLCGTAVVADGAWHHVAAVRRRSDGILWLFVDGNLDAQAAGPGGDVSYPDAGVPGNFCGGPCTGSDPFLVLGAAKHDVGAASPSFFGLLDELRISTTLRYTSAFSAPRAPFVPDAATAALFHFDEAPGSVLYDVAIAPGGRSHGDIRRASANAFPQWSTDTPFNAAPFALGTGTVALTAVASGFSSPVDVVSLPDGTGRMIVVEQGGLARIVAGGVVLPQPFLNVTGKTTGTGERGLLSLAFHPAYRANGRLFVLYTRNTDGALVLERYDRDPANPDRANPASGKVLLTIPHSANSNHNGGKLLFRRDGYLYWSTGDGGSGNDPPNNAQNLASRLGKMLRLNIDVETAPYYAIPPSNPFAAQSCVEPVSGTCPEIWSLGLRNPFRASVDRITDDLWIGDVGQGDREEIDFEPAGTPGGRNYGWRILEGLICTPAFGATCTPPVNYAPPVLDYDHGQGVSVTGGFRYRGHRIPALAGSYLYTDFSSRRLWAATVDAAGTWTATLLITAPGNISGFGEDDAGELVAVGYFDGNLYRLVAPDTDGDGLADWWERIYFASPTAATATGNPDADAFDNLAEFQARSDPLNAQGIPLPYAGTAPVLISENGVVCTVGAPCSAPVVALGSPPPILQRSGTLPAGLSFDPVSGLLQGTPVAGSQGFWPQTIVAQNGVGAPSVQSLGILVVAPCGGFADVPGASIFCDSVEWMANRAVTFGCTATNFCPDANITRASMALFINRLGLVLTPAPWFVDAQTGALDPDANPVICATAPMPPANYPRTALASAAFSGLGAGEMILAPTLVMSLDAGNTWGPVNASTAPIFATATGWVTSIATGRMDVAPAESVRFALRIVRVGGTADLADSTCQLLVKIVNRNATTLPH
jgi:glucose/arabinose dehydrogenase